MEVDIKVHAKLMQRLLNLRKHHLYTVCTEGFLHFFIAALQGGWILLYHGRSDVLDIGSAIAILRSWLTLRGRHEGAGETVNLAAMVIEVILAGNLRAGCLQHATQGISYCGPTSTAEVDRTGGVSGDEF